MKKNNVSAQLYRISNNGVRDDLAVDSTDPLADSDGRAYVISIPGIVGPNGTVTTDAPQFFTTGGTLVIQALLPGSSMLLQLAGYNAAAGLLYVQIHDSVGAIVAGHVPLVTIPVPGGNTAFSYGLHVPVTDEVVIALSTTPLTFTAATASLGFTAEYI